jgi:hypothetical protein
MTFPDASFCSEGDTSLTIEVKNKDVFYKTYVDINNNNESAMVVQATDTPNQGARLFVRIANTRLAQLLVDPNVSNLGSSFKKFETSLSRPVFDCHLRKVRARRMLKRTIDFDD